MRHFVVEERERRDEDSFGTGAGRQVRSGICEQSGCGFRIKSPEFRDANSVKPTAEIFRKDKMNTRDRLLISLQILTAAALLLAASPDSTLAQTLTFEEYEPKSTMVVPEHKVPRAKFPMIDIHSHHNRLTPEYVDKLIKEMDSINLRVIVKDR